MKKKIISLLLAGLFVLSNITVTYATEGEIADMQAQKQQAEAGLAQAQAVQWKARNRSWRIIFQI